MKTATLKKQLEEVQAKARVRTLDIEDVQYEASRIERFLKRSPNGTTVSTNWEPVANCYKGIPEGTYVVGRKDDNGKITMNVCRSRNAFGRRDYTIAVPEGHELQGDGTHHSGAVDNLRKAKIVKREASE